MGAGGRWGGRLFEAGRLLTFSAVSMGAYSRWAVIRGWALIRINTVVPTRFSHFFLLNDFSPLSRSLEQAVFSTKPVPLFSSLSVMKWSFLWVILAAIIFR